LAGTWLEVIACINMRLLVTALVCMLAAGPCLAVHAEWEHGRTYNVSTEPLGEFVQTKGTLLTAYSWGDLSNPSATGRIKDAQAMNANWIGVAFFMYQLNETSNFLLPPAPDNTPRPKDVIDYAWVAYEAGLRVFIKPGLVCSNGATFISVLPEDPAAWFANYTESLCSYGRSLPPGSAFSIGTELKLLTGNETFAPYWDQLITDVRTCLPPNTTLTYGSLVSESMFVTFWDKLDWIGLDEYLPVCHMDEPCPDTVTEMADELTSVFSKFVTHFNNVGLAEKTIIFTECGCSSFHYSGYFPSLAPQASCTNPTPYGFDGSPNVTIQAMYYEATFQAINNMNGAVEGIFMFHADKEGDPDYCRHCDIHNLTGDDKQYGDASSHPMRSIIAARAELAGAGDIVGSREDADSRSIHEGPMWPCWYSFRGKPAEEALYAAFGGSME